MSSLRFRYQTSEFGDHDIHFRSLKDRRQFEDIDGVAEALGISSANWPLFGMVWPSGEVLAKLMTSYDIADKRILEIGCGVGLASLVLNERLANIRATDVHPCAEGYLRHNTGLNSGREIPYLRTAWEDDQNGEFGIFDLIIGSDLLYERQHCTSLSGFIAHYAKPDCDMILVEAGRGYAGEFGKLMLAMGFSHSQMEHIAPDSNPERFKGKIHRYSRNTS